SALAGALVVAVLAWTRTPSPTEGTAATATPAPGIITAQVPGALPSGDAPAQAASAAAPMAPQAMASPLDAITPPACRTDAQGELVIDPGTRNDVELITALHKPAQALAKLDEACQDQGPKARQAMKNLYQQFVQYAQAVTQTFPPDEQIAIPVEKLEAVLLKGLHDLRVQYFGAETACAMYCEEEELTRRMLAVAVDYKQKNPKASTEESVGMAQAEIMKEIEAKEAA